MIDETALYQALINEIIAGVALDVFEQEPLPAGHPLTKLDNILLSPHVAGQTEESLIRMSVSAAENILAVFSDKIPPFVVNREVLKK